MLSGTECNFRERKKTRNKENESERASACDSGPEIVSESVPFFLFFLK